MPNQIVNFSTDLNGPNRASFSQFDSQQHPYINATNMYNGVQPQQQNFNPDYNSLMGELNQLKQLIYQQQQTIDKMNNDIMTISNQLMQSRNINAQLSQENNELKTKLNTQLDNFQKKENKIQAMINIKQADYIQLEKRLEYIVSDNVKLKSIVDELNSEKDKLTLENIRLYEELDEKNEPSNVITIQHQNIDVDSWIESQTTPKQKDKKMTNENVEKVANKNKTTEEIINEILNEVRVNTSTLVEMKKNNDDNLIYFSNRISKHEERLDDIEKNMYDRPSVENNNIRDICIASGISAFLGAAIYKLVL
jgi:chromosome segregation ATPase